MLININDVLEGGLSLDIEESGAELVQMALGSLSAKNAKKLGFSFLSPVGVHLDLSRLDGNLLIAGSLKGVLGLQCANCTKDFSYDVASDFTYCTLVGLNDDGGGESDFESALDAKSAHVEDAELNVTALVLEQISLEVPVKPLCSKGCKGLCTKCGTDLNESKCDCASAPRVDPRLAGLKEFRVKK
jgi:uncharacterized protein